MSNKIVKQGNKSIAPIGQPQQKQLPATQDKGVITVKPAEKPISDGATVALIILIILLALVSISVLGEDFAYAGSVVVATIPGLICSWIIYRAFNKNKGMAAVSGVLAVAIMAWAGILNSFISGTYQFLLAISNMAGFVAGLILAGILGVVIREVMKK